MPKVFNLGSINHDQTISVTTFPAPGETITGAITGSCLGGKGLNVSIALLRAGCAPVHIGAVGKSDENILSQIADFGIDVTQIATSDFESGKAFILLDASAENSIIVCPGANHAITDAQLEVALSSARAGDWLVLQNETNGQKAAIKIARAKNMNVAYMAAPFDPKIVGSILQDVDLLAVNETEWRQLNDFMGLPEDEFAPPYLLVTKGAAGASFRAHKKTYDVQGMRVKVKDTTAAGDTFFGFFLAEFIKTGDAIESLNYANAAAALAVQTYGASQSIPNEEDVRKAQNDQKEFIE